MSHDATTSASSTPAKTPILDSEARLLLSSVQANIDGAVEFVPDKSKWLFRKLAADVRLLLEKTTPEVQERLTKMVEERAAVLAHEKLLSLFGLEGLSTTELTLYAKRLQEVAEVGKEYEANWRTLVAALDPKEPTLESVLERLQELRQGEAATDQSPSTKGPSDVEAPIDGLPRTAAMILWGLVERKRGLTPPNSIMLMFLKASHDEWIKENPGNDLICRSMIPKNIEISDRGKAWLDQYKDKFPRYPGNVYDNLFQDPRFEEKSVSVGLPWKSIPVDLQAALVEALDGYTILVSVVMHANGEEWEATAKSNNHRASYTSTGTSRVSVLHKLLEKLSVGSFFRGEHARLDLLALSCQPKSKG